MVAPNMTSVRPRSNWLLTTAATDASSIQPMASSTAAPVMVMVPSWLRTILSSSKILPRTGKAVIDRAVPKTGANPRGGGGTSLAG